MVALLCIGKNGLQQHLRYILILETGGFITQFYPYMLTRLVIYLMEYYTPKVFNSILLQRQVSSIINNVNDLQNRPLTIY